MSQVQIAELNFLFYDNCCQSESGALWVILASGIHASAFMPLLVKVVWETVQIIHQRFTLIPFKIIKTHRKRLFNNIVINAFKCHPRPLLENLSPKIKAHVLNDIQKLIRVEILWWWLCRYPFMSCQTKVARHIFKCGGGVQCMSGMGGWGGGIPVRQARCSLQQAAQWFIQKQRFYREKQSEVQMNCMRGEVTLFNAVIPSEQPRWPWWIGRGLRKSFIWT